MRRTNSLLIALSITVVALPGFVFPTAAQARRLPVPLGVLRVVASPLHVITSRVRSVTRRSRVAAIAPALAAPPGSDFAMGGIGRGPGVYWTFTFNDLMDDVLQPADGRRYVSVADICAPQAARTDGDAAAKHDADAAMNSLVQMLQPSEAQRIALDALHTAWTHALDDLAAACPATAPATPAQRLAATADYLSALWRAAIHVHTPLEKFYGTLTDEQKARLNGPPVSNSDRATPAEASKAPSPSRLACTETARVIPAWPAGRLEQQLGPSPEQRAGLAALRTTSTKMAEFVAASCPRDPPATPLARLSAEENQLITMYFAVQAIGEPLAKFYDSLSDVQKSRFQASLQ